ncbi:MAG: transglycosylase domain-containing protein [Marinifilaceae bacterium]
MFKRHWKFISIFWGCFIIGITAIFILFSFISAGKLGFMPTFEELENPNNRFASELYFEDGPSMGKYFWQSENRKYTEFNQIPQNVIDALIATEDARFYDHSGIDVRGLFRVVGGLATGNSSAGGGSTISQQLAKMLFPREADLSKPELVIRKFREWIIATRLEKSYTKDEIITMYLNKYDFGNLAVGLSSAADIYFQTTTDSLGTEQAAMLVGMAKNSSLFNPIRRPELTLQRRNVVLNQMYKYNKITKAEADSLKALPLGVTFKRADHKEGLATYFREHIRLFLMANEPNKKDYTWNKDQYKIDSTAWKNNPLYGWCNKNKKTNGENYNIYTDGLQIHTTLNSRMQRYAEESVTEHLSQTLQPQFTREAKYKRNPPFSNDVSPDDVKDILNRSIKRSERYRAMKAKGTSEKDIIDSFNKKTDMTIFTWNGLRDTTITPLDSLKHYKSFFRAAFMASDPQTGEIRAYVGGPDYRYFMYDMVSTGKRQVGSTIKPLLYTLAMQEGLTPCDKVPNIPQTFILPDGKAWTARGGDKHQGEMVTLRWGLANSENNISGWVLKQFSPQAVANMAYRMGITSFIDPVPSVFLGTAEISLREMVSAYSIFANKGVYNSSLPITRIEDKYGNVLAAFKAESREVIPEETAYLMCDLLKSVIQQGTGVRMRYRYKITNPVGGKTGTTQNHSDGWFMAVTPELTGGVWVGAEDRSIHFQTLQHGQGANMALPIWATFLQKVYADPNLNISKTDFERPYGYRKSLNCESVEQKTVTIQEDEEIF